MGAVNSPRVHWKAGQRPMGAGAGLHLQWKSRPESWWGSILRRRLQRSNRPRALKGYASAESFFGSAFRELTPDGGGPPFQATRRRRRPSQDRKSPL